MPCQYLALFSQSFCSVKRSSLTMPWLSYSFLAAYGLRSLVAANMQQSAQISHHETCIVRIGPKLRFELRSIIRFKSLLLPESCGAIYRNQGHCCESGPLRVISKNRHDFSRSACASGL